MPNLKPLEVFEFQRCYSRRCQIGSVSVWLVSGPALANCSADAVAGDLIAILKDRGEENTVVLLITVPVLSTSDFVVVLQHVPS